MDPNSKHVLENHLAVAWIKSKTGGRNASSQGFRRGMMAVKSIQRGHQEGVGSPYMGSPLERDVVHRFHGLGRDVYRK